MSICDIHKLENNKHGFCNECENDENINIYKCKKCNAPYAMHKNSSNSVGMCPKCMIDLMES
jgi:uncharacterized paraquat-inducible protein A